MPYRAFLPYDENTFVDGVENLS
jgi:hypothetical protein